MIIKWRRPAGNRLKQWDPLPLLFLLLPSAYLRPLRPLPYRLTPVAMANYYIAIVVVNTQHRLEKIHTNEATLEEPEIKELVLLPKFYNRAITRKSTVVWNVGSKTIVPYSHAAIKHANVCTLHTTHMRYMRKASERARGRGPERVTSASDYHLLSLM